MTPPVQYGPRLIEEAVQLELWRRRDRAEDEPLREYHRRADPLYHLAGERREQAFAALHRRLFEELGFEAPLGALLGGYRALLARIASLTLLHAVRVGDEGADLGPPTDGGKPALVRLRAVRFLDPGGLGRFLDHELARLGDLLDPAFGHDPEALVRVPPARRRLVQERYRVAWAVSLDGRLARRGKAPLADLATRRQELARIFPGLPGPEQVRLFETLWKGDRPTHRRLLALALGARGAHEPGAPCPLCGFPTHRWAEPRDPVLVEAIRGDAPGWRPDERLCERCLEGYRILAATPR